MALGSTQPLTEMNTRNLPGGEGWPARKRDNVTAICEPIVYKLWESRRPTTLWAFMACYRDNFTVFFLHRPYDTRAASEYKFISESSIEVNFEVTRRGQFIQIY
jgi:hypothetical protein